MKTRTFGIISLIVVTLVSGVNGCALPAAQSSQTPSANTNPSTATTPATPEVNTSDTAQEIKEPTEPVLINSDNVSRREPTEEDYDAFIARLRENTYLPAETFGIRALTEQEKADCIAIASQHPAVSGFIGSGQEYITGFQWIGLSLSGGYGLLPYDTVEKGIPSVLGWPKRATFYLAVNFDFGSYVVTLAVDPDKKEVVYVTRGLIQNGPTSAPQK